MPFIKGYFYVTKTAANQAVKTINTGEGIPAFPDSVTTTYCEPMECFDGWYLPFDEVTSKYLGTPVDVELPEPERP